jgi:hypothetical protein
LFVLNESEKKVEGKIDIYLVNDINNPALNYNIFWKCIKLEYYIYVYIYVYITSDTIVYC